MTTNRPGNPQKVRLTDTKTDKVTHFRSILAAATSINIPRESFRRHMDKGELMGLRYLAERV